MSASDMAIDGNGFFIVNNGGTNLYTRDGSFSQDTNGNLVTAGGLAVMGYPAANGAVNTNAPLTAINIPLKGQVQQPTASTTMSMTANLDSEATSPFPATVPVVDSLGATHNVTVTFTQTGANMWNYSAALPAADFANGVSTPITGTMQFDPTGQLTTITPTAGVAETVGTAPGDVSSIALDFANPMTDGANELNLQWNMLGSAGLPTISQTDEASGLSGVAANGNAAGTCEGFTIGSDGTVTAQYTSGTQIVGQVALADVTNLQGLQLLGNGNYATTLASGPATAGVSGSGGLGTIQDSALEASNVNISSEFSNLIVAQRAFEANAKSVTTFDTVTQDTINMVH
jgi:flagellar hook protein FlgE